MNFFQHQDDARRKSGQLILLLGLAVIALIIMTSVVVAGLLYYLHGNSTSIQAYDTINTSFADHLVRLFSSEMILWIAAGVIGVVAMGSLYKSSQLKRGGDYVAQALGGKLLLREQASAQERTLLNVVEEMAIASGTPVPRVYMLEEDGINAFAAGTQPSNAVVGITKGCVSTLNREQLQGVIAHEFSHIHHGDMRLNMRLIAILHGILLIGLIGEMLARSNTSRSLHHRNRNKKGNSGAVIGLALMAIGFSGVFFGNIIKAAVSRQREYLADASAVKYTRNPRGIAAALLQIKRNYSGSSVSSSHASEFSHFFFANGVRSFFSKIFATHPALDDRIARIYPKSLTELEASLKSAPNTVTDAEFSQTEKSTSQDLTNKNTNAPKAQGLDSLINHIGEIHPFALDYSHVLLTSLPAVLHQACASPYQARAVVYSLLLDDDEIIRSEQTKHLASRAHPATYTEFLKIHNHISNLDEQLKFPLLQLAQPALKNLSEPQARLFKENLFALAKADKKMSIKEWSVLTYILGCDEAPLNTKVRKVNQLKSEIIALLSFTCLLNKVDQQQTSLTSAIQTIWPGDVQATPTKLSLKQLNENLSKLKQLSPIQKPMVLKAVAHCMSYDGDVSIREKDILRTFSAVLDAPIPIIAEMDG